MRKLRFSDAVASIESRPKALRNMLQNPKLVLPSPSRDGWAEFTPIQLALLAIIRRLVDFGYSVERASITACMSVVGAFAATERKDGQSLTAGEFLALLQREYLVAYVVPGEIDILTEHRQSDGWPTLNDELQKLAVLTVPVSAVVARCFARAPVLPEDDMTGSDGELIQALLQFQTEFYAPGEAAPHLIIPAVSSDKTKPSKEESAAGLRASPKSASR